jgi:hypothetical protein
MNEEAVLKSVLNQLEFLGINYMITGSMASNFHGPPRATKDADIIIDTDEKSLRQLIARMQGEFYADEAMAVDALKTRFMFNIIHLQTGFKIDFIIRKPDGYSSVAFKRRVKGEFSAASSWFASAEDLVLSKLQWHQMGGSARQLEDAVAVVKLQQTKLDVPYMKHWAKTLGIEDLLNEVLAAIEI